MKLADIERINNATLQKIREQPGSAVWPKDQYFGFYEVDLFECPPFIMFTANDCPRGQDILYYRRFEPMSMKVWCRLALKASGIFDIGAQVGVYALSAASLRQDLKIQAFEPNPHAYTRLRMNIAANGFGNIVENRFALAHQAGYTNFSWVIKPGQPISSGGSLAGPRDGMETVVVETRRLDDVPAAASIGSNGLVKIDVEGAEDFVFSGMPNFIAHKPDIILETFSEQSCNAINPVILPLGYRVYGISEKDGTLVRQQGLTPRLVSSGDFNQFLTVKSEAELEVLMA